MKKTIRYIAIGFLLIFLVAVIVFKRRHRIRDITNPNSISIVIDNKLNVNDFTILWGSDHKTKKVLFKNNIDLRKTFKEYGNNYFYVCYQDSIIAKFLLFKHNDWHGHDYKFQIIKNDGKIMVDWIVKGPDSKRIDELDLSN